MYPGDVTNNGEVNGIDVLYIGIAYGFDGTPRNNAETDWLPQDITTPWATMFSNGLNHAYADCDGNGMVDDDDIGVVMDNFGQTQPSVVPDTYSNGTGGVDPAFTLTKTSGAVGLSSTVDFSLALGSSSIPVNDFYGIAFTLSYDPTIFVDLDFQFLLTDGTWITTTTGGDFEDLEIWEIEDQVPGEINLAITRNDQLPISGSGEIGTFSIVVEDIIVGMVEDTTTLIAISRVRMISDDMTEIPVVTDTFPLIITDTSNPEPENEAELSVFPNPMTDYITVKSIHASITNTVLFDLLGQKIPISIMRESADKINVHPIQNLPPGVFSLSVFTDYGILTRKVLVLR